MGEARPVTITLLRILAIGFVVGFVGGFLGSHTYMTFFSNSNGAPVIEESRTQTDEQSTIAAVEHVMPSVVDIVISKDIASFSNQTGPNVFPFDDIFEFPFDFKLELPETPSAPEMRRQKVGGGSGFIISDDGLIVTNKHVVNDEDADFTVILNDGTTYDAELLGVDPFNDLAILKIAATGLPAVTLGDSDNLIIGQSVIAIGNSLGEYQNTVTKGVISGINRRVQAGGNGISEIIEEAIQTDAAINPGNSGGPLINLSGEVVGVNTAISLSGQLIGFAIPINTAKKVTDSVLEYGRIIRPWLGVRYIINSSSIAQENGYSVDYGALLLSGRSDGKPAVLPESPADKAGLQEEDIILEVNNDRIDETNPLGKVIAKYQPGDTVELRILREKKEMTLSVILEEYTE